MYKNVYNCSIFLLKGLWVLVNSENYSHLKLGTLIIKGTLEFAYEEELAYTLEADFIIILGGFLYAGWKDNPMIGTMSIVLTGNANTPPYTELDGYDIGSKALGKISVSFHLRTLVMSTELANSHVY